MKHLFIFILSIITLSTSAQIKISGTIKDAETNLPLSNVNIIISALQTGSTTNDSGYYLIHNIPEGKHELKIQHIGYKTKTTVIKCETGKNLKKNFELEKDINQFDEIVITATRNEQHLANIPNKIHIINSKKIEAVPMLNIDDAFKISSGINIDRPFGIFAAKSTVTMRGLSGTEQGRTLVLVDGIPVNKTDDGTVNFNMVDLEKSNKIEILKGPASALYGGNAMGGAINIISPKSEKKLEGTIYTKYSTYNTLQSGATLRGKINLKQNFMYCGVNGNYAQSDGYISTPPARKNSLYCRHIFK